MAENTQKTLSPVVADKYNLVGIPAGRTILPRRFGSLEVDFSTMTLEQADKLAALPEFPYLKVKKPAAPVPSGGK